MPNPQANSKKESTKVFWRAGNVTFPLSQEKPERLLYMVRGFAGQFLTRALLRRLSFRDRKGTTNQKSACYIMSLKNWDTLLKKIYQRTMTICVASLSWGNLGHGHRLFLSQGRFSEDHDNMCRMPFLRESWSWSSSFSFSVMRASFRQEASITWCDLFRPRFGQKVPKIISLHDVLEPLKQALLASRDVILSSQICGSNLQKVFTIRWRMLAAQFCQSDQSALIDAALWRTPL